MRWWREPQREPREEIVLVGFCGGRGRIEVEQRPQREDHPHQRELVCRGYVAFMPGRCKGQKPRETGLYGDALPRLVS